MAQVKDTESPVELSQVNAAISKLSKQPDGGRGRAAAILAKFGARNTPELRRSDYGAVLDLTNEALACTPEPNGSGVAS
jgi:hypothetical protein